MSNFKIEAVLPSSTLQPRQVGLLPLAGPSVSITSISLLTYDLDTLIESVSDFLKGEDNYQLLERTLKVLGASLNDKKLSGNLQTVIFENEDKPKRIYELAVCWSHACRNMVAVLLKLSVRLRKFMISNIVSHYFLDKVSGQKQIKMQLAQFLLISSQKQLVQRINASYLQASQPLSTLIMKARQLNSRSNDLTNLIKEVLKHAVEKSDAKVAHMMQSLAEYEPHIAFLNRQLPLIGNVLVKHFKKTITIDNVLDERNVSKEFNALIRSAVKEWVEEGHHFWLIVDRHFELQGRQREEVLTWGATLSKDNLFNQTMTVKYLYFFFEGEQFDFNSEDRMIAGLKTKEMWTDTYRSISQCLSWQHFNLIAINVTNSVKHWKTIDPFALQIKHKNLKKIVKHYSECFKKFQKQYLQRNKKIELAYSSLLVTIDGTQKVVSFEQLLDYCEREVPIEGKGYRNSYLPYQEEIKVKEEPRKDHNIVVEAKLVRLLKRNKTSLTVQFLSRESKYEESVVALAMKRLENKGIADLEQNQTYTYVP